MRMTDQLIGIGAAGKMSGLSERTLRYWESLGLITPVRMPSGHRKYSKAMVKTIIALKETLEKNNLRINDLVTSSGFLQDEALRRKVKDLGAFNLRAQMESFYADVRRDMRLNPFSGLPDHFFSQQETERRLEEGRKIAICYIDLQGFRFYNQRYDYPRGDRVLKFLAALIFEKMRDFGGADDFAGHLGADDFVMLTTPDRYAATMQELIKSFDAMIGQHYDKADREAGRITLRNRRGEELVYPVMSLSVGVVTNERRNLLHFAQAGDIGLELKRFASTFKRSEMVVDRRVN
jgi:diguanylate cyclase (GGDEF)-like protein